MRREIFPSMMGPANAFSLIIEAMFPLYLSFRFREEDFDFNFQGVRKYFSLRVMIVEDQTRDIATETEKRQERVRRRCGVREMM
jgi:hypothetical protein